MLRWIAVLFGFEPIRYPASLDSTAPKNPLEIGVDKLRWPEGPQARKEVQGVEPAGWDHTNWAWRSIGFVNHLGSLHPQVSRAECRFCLGVLKCGGCGTFVRPKTKSAQMNAQLARGCPRPACGDTLQWMECEARIYLSVFKEDGVEYSSWEHTGYHYAHPRPPIGQQPSGLLKPKPEPERSGNASRAQNYNTGDTAARVKLKTNGVRKAILAPALARNAPLANVPASVVVAEPAEAVVWRDEKTTAKSKLYAARIEAGNKHTASLAWHFGNVYTAGEAPASPMFTRSARECTDALDYAGLNAASRSNVGKIRWPLRLQEEAAFYNYTNDAIQTALYNAFSSMVDILSGARHHPLVQLFHEHMATKQKEFETANQRAATENELHNLAQTFSFPVPNLAGDASLMDGFLAELAVQLRKGSGTISRWHNLRLLNVGPPLLLLVMVREYLHLPPENDHDLFELVKERRISRVWTPHEQALAACHGETNTRSNSQLSQPPTPTRYEVLVDNDGEFVISDDEPFVAVKSVESVNWTNRPGLSGGVLVPRRYRPPHLRVAPTGPRPKPRPAYKVRFNLPGESAAAGYSSRGSMEEERVVLDGVGATGTSADGQENAKEMRKRVPLGTIVENKEELRRSKRARTT